MRYVIIGASAAGTEAACELRRIDVTADITVISDELKGPYSRCLLPKFVDGRLTEDRLYFKARNFFKDYNIISQRGVTVTKIDRASRYVVTEKSEKFYYDKLLIATGSHPFLPENIEGCRLKGVSTFHTLEDAKEMLKM